MTRVAVVGLVADVDGVVAAEVNAGRQREGAGGAVEGAEPHDKEEERRQDMELATEIAARKKATSERAIKLTVVLMASRRMLGAPCGRSAAPS